MKGMIGNEWAEKKKHSRGRSLSEPVCEQSILSFDRQYVEKLSIIQGLRR